MGLGSGNWIELREDLGRVCLLGNRGRSRGGLRVEKSGGAEERVSKGDGLRPAAYIVWIPREKI